MKRETSKYLKFFIFLVLSIVVLSACNPKEPVVEPNGESFNLPNSDIFEFTEIDQLAKIWIYTDQQELPESKEDGSLDVTFKMSMGNESFEAYGTIKVQGSSTSLWPKKNWSLSFYLDPEHEEPMKLKIGDSIVSDKWITKADWIDPTMLRNGISYKLWEAIVNNRETEPKFEVDNAFVGMNPDEISYKGAVGYPKSFPAIVYMDDEHYGLSLLILGHDPNNFNIDKENPNHIYMEFDARYGDTLLKTWEKFVSGGLGMWIDGYYPKNENMSQEHLDAIDNFGAFLNSDLEEFAYNFDQFLDKSNIIDMLLFLEAIYDWDAVAQDIEIITYDLKKWYFLPWDKDTTFGLFWDGSGLIEDSSTTKVFDYLEENVEQKPWFKTYHAFTDEVEARYAQLREKNILSVEAISDFALSILDKYSDEMWQAEYERWESEERPSIDETDLNQILNWFGERLLMMDEHFNYNP